MVVKYKLQILPMPWSRIIILTLTLGFFVLWSKAYAQNNTNYACSVAQIERDINEADEWAEKSHQDSARFLLNRALQCAQKLDQQYLKAKVLLELGIVEFRQVGPRDVPTKLFLESLALYTQLNDLDGIERCNLQLGVLNYDIRNFETAVVYFQNMLEAKTSNTRMRGIAHYLLALSFSELKNFEKAKEMFELAVKEIEQSDSEFHMLIQAFKGKMYLNKGDNETAVTVLENALVEHKTIINEEGSAPIFSFLSTGYLRLGNYDKAIFYGKKAFNLSLGRGSNTIYLREAESSLYKAYFEKGIIDSAYFFLESLSDLNDSVSSQQVVQRVTEMSGQYEFEQKLRSQQAEQQLKDKLAEKEIERQKLIRNLLFIGFILVGIFALVFFRQRTKITKEKERSDNLLLNILPEEIAQELKENGKAEARNFDMVSILFTDFKGFTEASAKLSAGELVSEINSCFEVFDDIVDKYNIEKIKTIGDAYMAAGGLPIPTKHSLKNTVLAALEMQEFIANRKAKNHVKEKPAFEMRVGIHTGPVVAGIVGVKKFQYDIWGDTVNTASRMESNGEVGKVNISNDTYKLLKDDPQFLFESRGMIEVKGKGEMEMWFVSKNTSTT